MPINKIIRYEHGWPHPGAQQLYTMQEMADALKIKKSDVVALLYSGRDFSHHISERNSRGKLEYFWRVDGRDGDSFRKNVRKWKAMTRVERALAIADGRSAVRQQRKRGTRI
jgi:hypothetical protein